MQSGLPWLAPAVDAAVVVVTMGAGTAYLMIAGDTLWLVCGGHRALWVVLATAFVAPLACMDKIDALAATSGAAMVGTCIYLRLHNRAPTHMYEGYFFSFSRFPSCCKLFFLLYFYICQRIWCWRAVLSSS